MTGERVAEFMRRRFALFVGATALAFVAAVAVVLALPKNFRATAKVLVAAPRAQEEKRPREKTDAELRAARYVATQVEVLRSLPVEQRALRAAGLAKGEALYAVRNVEGTDVIVVRAESRDAAKAVRFANAVAEAYVAHVKEESRKGLNGAIGALEREKDLAAAQVVAAEESRRKFLEGSQWPGTAEDRDALTQKLTEMEQALGGRLKERETLAEEMRGTRAKLAREEAKVVAESEKEEKPGQDAESMRQALMMNLDDQMRAESENNAQIATLKSAIGQLRTRIAQLPDEAMQLSMLNRAIEQTEARRIALEKELQDARVAEATLTAPASVLERAEWAVEVSGRRRPEVFALALLAAMALGALAAGVVHALDDTIYHAEDAARRIGIEVFSEIPHDAAFETVPLVMHSFPNSPVAEEFRSLCDATRSLMRQTGGKVAMVTSSVVEEGKSSVAANLAVAMAQKGLETLLVDADLRHPAAAAHFEVRNEGLTNIAVEGAAAERMVQPTGIPRLYALAAGAYSMVEASPYTPAELFESKAVKQLFEGLRERFDVIVVDSPAILTAAETVSLAKLADGILLVLGAGFVRRTVAADAIARLDTAGTPVIGAVLNKASKKPADALRRMRKHRPTEKSVK